MIKKQPVLSAIDDIVNQLEELAEEGVLTDAQHNVKQLKTQWDELGKRLANRKLVLQVN